MNTFDAIAYIQDQSMNRPDAMRFLVERLGINSIYADEIIAVVFSGRTSLDNTEKIGNTLSRKLA